MYAQYRKINKKPVTQLPAGTGGRRVEGAGGKARLLFIEFDFRSKYIDDLFQKSKTMFEAGSPECTVPESRAALADGGRGG